MRTGDGRLGLYFLNPGAGLRASEVVYDRAHSAFADAPAEGWDWDTALAGCDRLHLSGITPALGPNSAAAAMAAADAAAARGIKVSFDGNYRARLWEAWDSDPRAVLTRLIGHADILFGNHRDISLLLGSTSRATARTVGGSRPRRRSRPFPRLELIASTARHVDDADSHRIAARIDTRAGAHQTDEVLVAGIVDRIGAGDAFAAGVLHGLIETGDPAVAAETGLALTCLKHSLPGDMSLFRREDLAAFQAAGSTCGGEWCRLQESNPRPSVYKTVALPAELNRRIVPLASAHAEGPALGARELGSERGRGQSSGRSAALRSQAAVSSASAP